MSPADPPAVTNSAGDVLMRPGETKGVLDAIQQPIDAWSTSWPAKLAGIRADEQAVNGFDDLTTAFRTTYNQVEPELTSSLNQFAPRITSALATGRTIVADYVETFRRMTGHLTT